MVFTKINKLKNVITAMITPFNEDLELDEEKYRDFIRFKSKTGVNY